MSFPAICRNCKVESKNAATWEYCVPCFNAHPCADCPELTSNLRCGPCSDAFDKTIPRRICKRCEGKFRSFQKLDYCQSCYKLRTKGNPCDVCHKLHLGSGKICGNCERKPCSCGELIKTWEKMCGKCKDSGSTCECGKPMAHWMKKCRECFKSSPLKT